jgi:hypothetical protein
MLLTKYFKKFYLIVIVGRCLYPNTRFLTSYNLGICALLILAFRLEAVITVYSRISLSCPTTPPPLHPSPPPQLLKTKKQASYRADRSGCIFW